MGLRNYLVEGVSGAGKTSVCEELLRRGFHAVHGDRVLAHQGGPGTGEPTPGLVHDHHVWDLDAVRALVADRSVPVTFLCGGSRNHARFLPLLDGVFVLQVDRDTLLRRLSTRTDEFGGRPAERDLVLRLHATGEDLPPGGVPIDATAPVSEVVDEVLRHVAARPAQPRPRRDPA